MKQDIDVALVDFENWCLETNNSDLESFIESHGISSTVSDELRSVIQQERRLRSLIAGVKKRDSTAAPIADLRGCELGNYRLIRRIGVGGMGTVWLGEQQTPVHRQVAIKLIREGFGTAAIAKRFRVERQALAMMSHPNIAQLLEAGQQQDQLYLVMEYVEGTPITDYCNSRKLSLDQRIQLLLQVCIAVQHAHQKGLIHRDLKPENVLVSEIDQAPLIKVIDFGLAKLIQPTRRPPVRLTQSNAALGSPLWMSPEQAGSRSPDGKTRTVDTRSDLYSIGVILFQLLTNTTPISSDFYETATPAELLQAVAEQDCPYPSVRLSQDKAAPHWVQHNTSSHFSSWSNSLRSELDWVTQKLLEKDPERRYASVSSLADDLQRFLDGKPIMARPQSATYQVKKFVSRNRVASLATAIVITTLMIAMATSLLLTNWALTANKTAALEKGNALAEKEEAQKQKRLADLQRNRAERISEYVVEGFGDLNVANSDVVYNKFIENFLVARRNAISSTDFSEDPRTEADLRVALADALSGLGKHEIAIEELVIAEQIFQTELGANAQETNQSRLKRAREYLELRMPQKAGKLADKCLLTLNREHEHAFELRSTAQLIRLRSQLGQGRVNRSIAGLKELARSTKLRLSNDHPISIHLKVGLADAYVQKFLFGIAAEHLDEARNLAVERWGDRNKNTVAINLKYWKTCAQDFQLSQSSHGKLNDYLDAAIQKFGASNPFVFELNTTLGETLLQQGQVAQAISQLSKNLTASCEHLGKEHTVTAMAKLAYANALSLKEPRQARELFQEVCDSLQNNLGEQSPEFFLANVSMGENLFALEQYKEAIDLIGQLLSDMDTNFGNDTPLVFKLLDLKARCLMSLGRNEKAIELFAENYQRMVDANDLDSLQAGQAMWRMATASYLQEDFGKAIEYYGKSFEIYKRIYGAKRVDTHALATEFYNALLRQKRFPEADKYIEYSTLGSEELRSDLPILSDIRLLNQIANAEICLELGRINAAKTISQLTLGISFLKSSPTQHGRTESILGGCFVQQKEFEKAERSLLRAEQLFEDYQAMSKYQWYETRNWERLIDLYDAWDKPQKAQEYRERFNQRQKKK